MVPKIFVDTFVRLVAALVNFLDSSEKNRTKTKRFELESKFGNDPAGLLALHASLIGQIQRAKGGIHIATTSNDSSATVKLQARSEGVKRDNRIG